MFPENVWGDTTTSRRKCTAIIPNSSVIHVDGSGTVVSNSRSRQMRSDSGAKSQLSRLAFRKPAMLAVA